MTSIPNKTSIEFIDGLLEILKKFEETLVAARSFVLTNNDMTADGGDPFEAIYPEPKDEMRAGEVPTEEEPKVFSGVRVSVPSDEEVAAHLLGMVKDLPTLTAEIEQIRKEDSKLVDELQTAVVRDRFFPKASDSVLKEICKASDERTEATKAVVKKRRAKSLRRASVTPELREKILDALLSRQPRPRMVDVATEFEVSQSTVSRLLGIHLSENLVQDIGFVEENQHVPLPGQLELPIISEGRKPGLED